MDYLFFIFLGFISGSLMFAQRISKSIKGIDIQKCSEDHNPGVANAFMYAGFRCGTISLILDLAKGFAPVFLAQKYLHTDSVFFSVVMAAPVLGHAFPFFNRRKGGKAICVSFGVLLGILPEYRPLMYLAAIFIFFSVIFVINPHSVRSIVTYLTFATVSAFKIKCIPVAFGSGIISIIIIKKHISDSRGEQASVTLLRRTESGK